MKFTGNDFLIFEILKKKNLEKDMFDIQPADEGTYDIICFFLCLHDMTWPTKALKTVGKMLKPGGFILVAESPGNSN